MIDPAIRQIQRIENMPKESFVLYGDATKPGLYLQYQRRAPDMWIGTEPSGDRTGTVGVTKGGFIRDIAQGVHFDGSGDDPLWIQIAGVGPTATTNVDPPK